MWVIEGRWGWPSSAKTKRAKMVPRDEAFIPLLGEQEWIRRVWNQWTQKFSAKKYLNTQAVGKILCELFWLKPSGKALEDRLGRGCRTAGDPKGHFAGTQQSRLHGWGRKWDGAVLTPGKVSRDWWMLRIRCGKGVVRPGTKKC